MVLTPEIRSIPAQNLLGIRLSMSFAQDRTSELWRSFLPRQSEIPYRIGSDRFCLQVYDSNAAFETFSPERVYEKWAAVEVSHYDQIPEGMEAFTLSGGLYAVFRYKGTPAAFPPVARWIFQTWLPESGYRLDQRPHFEVMSAGYSPFDPDAEEDIYVPIIPEFER